jgi:hypothetical protein
MHSTRRIQKTNQIIQKGKSENVHFARTQGQNDKGANYCGGNLWYLLWEREKSQRPRGNLQEASKINKKLLFGLIWLKFLCSPLSKFEFEVLPPPCFFSFMFLYFALCFISNELQ